MATRVFLSSTCFDLIDVRAELEVDLREMGLLPVLSDSPTSDFRALPDRNSIESCLVNLRSCDIVIVVLCRRYGPSLAGAGFDDVSATHLEYTEARRLCKPLYVYARDRLEADYRHWRANGRRSDSKFSWANTPHGSRLLTLLDDHQTLSAEGGGTNWYGTFRSSVDLKQLIRRDLRIPAARGEIEALIRNNRVPILSLDVRLTDEVTPFRGEGHTLDLRVSNVGCVPAYNVSWEWEEEQGDRIAFEDGREAAPPHPILAPGTSTHQVVGVGVTRSTPKVERHLSVRYQTAQGHWVRERYRVGVRLPRAALLLHACSPLERVIEVAREKDIPYRIEFLDAPASQMRVSDEQP